MGSVKLAFGAPTSSLIVNSMNLLVNGEPRTASVGVSIIELLAFLQVNPQKVAVELNRAIISKAKWAETIVPPNSEIEIVQFVGGG